MGPKRLLCEGIVVGRGTWATPLTIEPPPPPYIDDIPSIQYIASIHTRTLLYCLYFTTYTVVLVRELDGKAHIVFAQKSF